MMRSLDCLRSNIIAPSTTEITMALPSQESTSIMDKLPSNILALCLNLLDAKDLVNCRNVCSGLLAVVDADINLLYKIELHANCMIDGPPSLVSPGARLDRLLEHQQRWRRCEWTTIRSLPLPALLKADGTETTDDAILTRGTLSSAFLFLGSYSRFIQWRSNTQDLEYLEWDVTLPRHLTLDLDFDSRQDLLAVLEIPEDDRDTMQLSVRHLNNGLPHRLARNSQLASFMAGSSRAAIRIYDCYVTLFIQAHFDLECRLSIYDWKAGGDPLMVLWRHNIEAATLISERYALLVKLRRSTSQLSLCIIDIHRRRNPDICSLLLPETSTMSSTCRVNVQCGPHSSPPHTLSNGCPLFATDPANQLVLVTFTNVPESFALFTLASTLVKLAERHQNDPSPVSIPWEEWGPENTRLIETAEEAGENLCVYGTKALIVHEQTQVLYDFNQRSIKRELARNSTGEAPDDIIIEASICDRERPFSTAVMTCLPYRFTPVGLDNFDKNETVVHVGETSIVYVSHPGGRDMTVLSI